MDNLPQSLRNTNIVERKQINTMDVKFNAEEFLTVEIIQKKGNDISFNMSFTEGFSLGFKGGDCNIIRGTKKYE